MLHYKFFKKCNIMSYKAIRILYFGLHYIIVSECTVQENIKCMMCFMCVC